MEPLKPEIPPLRTWKEAPEPEPEPEPEPPDAPASCAGAPPEPELPEPAPDALLWELAGALTRTDQMVSNQAPCGSVARTVAV